MVKDRCLLPPASGVQCSKEVGCPNNTVTLGVATYVCRCGVVICENCNTVESIRAKGLRCDFCVAKAPFIAARKTYDEASAGASKRPRTWF